MCIIAIARKGVAMPDLETIRNMWYRNPDGAGFMWADGKSVHIEKGFMELEDLEKRLEAFQKEVDTKANAVILHFRIGTAGGNVAANTHPFPITDDIPMLQKLRVKTPLAVAHNGVISITPRQKDISDTMEYIASQLAPLYRGVKDFYRNKNLMTMVGNAINGSRMAFMNVKGEIFTVGNFVTDEKTGMLYSNTSYEGGYKPYNAVHCGYYDYGWSDDDIYEFWSKKYPKGETLPAKGKSPFDDNYTYCTDLLMPLEDWDYIVSDAHMFGGDEENFWVSSAGELFWYDDYAMVCYPVGGNYTIYSDNGLPLKWDAKKAVSMPIDFEAEFEITDLIGE